VASTVSTIVTRRIVRIALNENASRLEQNAAVSLPMRKKRFTFGFDKTAASGQPRRRRALYNIIIILFIARRNTKRDFEQSEGNFT